MGIVFGCWRDVATKARSCTMGHPLAGAPGGIMELPNTNFETLLDGVEQLHQAISSDDANMASLAELLRQRLNQAQGQAELAAAWLDRRELLRWWLVSEQLPPDDVDVLVSWGDRRGSYMGAYVAGRGWVGVDALPLDDAPRYWCALPIGPIDAVQNP
jgi:hypothetical protein